MSDSLEPSSLPPSSVAPLRRQPVKLPSVWVHFFWSVAVLVLLTIGSWLFVKSFGKINDSIPTGSIQVEARPLPPQSDTLAGSSEALPDLLDGDVPLDTNPTEALLGAAPPPPSGVDALGNPLDTSSSADSTPPQTAPQQAGAIPVQAPPKAPRGTLRINGEIVGPAESLPPAPFGGLSRQSAFGPVPAPDSRGLTPHSAYARPYTPVAGKSPVALIIGGLGINRGLTQRAIDTLPANVTLSFAAHAPGLQAWINQARARGHEVLLEIPMEAQNFDPTEPGASRALMTTANSNRNLRNLDWSLSRAQGYFAITNYNGDKFLNRTDLVGPVLAHLKQSGLGFYFDGSSTAPSLDLVAQNAGLPFTRAYTVIDTSPETAAIRIELSRLQAKASSGATPLGIGFAFPETLAAIQNWITDIEAQGLVLVPASTIQTP